MSPRSRQSDGKWWRRWLESRWLLVTMATLAGAFFLAVTFEEPGVFSTVAVVALGAGQMNNTFSRPRPSARSRGGAAEETAAGRGQALDSDIPEAS